jgi:hypothetical protein
MVVANALDAELAQRSSAIVSTIVEQLGFVTIWPFQPRCCWRQFSNDPD